MELAALLFCIFSFIIASWLGFVLQRPGLWPVLVFVHEELGGWYLHNVGKGTT